MSAVAQEAIRRALAARSTDTWTGQVAARASPPGDARERAERVGCDSKRASDQACLRRLSTPPP
ncbi:hypothetical protein [Candidatus Dormiibacter inghamiae]|uniref:hypothetical protein n=1 Tax=Candidatus Dormiibacter inghamiae TaxID=3127013 RepID=UPI003312FB4D